MAIDIDEAKVKRNEMGLWLGWALATALGLIIGYLPSSLFVSQIDLGIARVIVPLLAGLMIGLAQWLVLRNYVTHTTDWVFYLGASWVLGYALGLLVVDLLAGSFWGMLLGYVLFGVIIAVFQYPVLHREIPHIWLWILANIVGWTLGGLLSMLAIAGLFGENPGNAMLLTIVNMAVTGLVAGLITGIALVIIVRQPDQLVAA
jgi:hypothetical protein